MEIRLIDNRVLKLLHAIEPAIAQAEDCRIAVAYLSLGGLELLRPAVQKCLDRGGCVEFLRVRARVCLALS